MLRGTLPRSPVWLRKIPSTVSGSQGSRRGLRPAVRFAFPLGAKMYITDFHALGQGKVRIRAELFRRAGGFRKIVDVSPGRAIVTDGPLPPILVEGSPQPGRSGAMREGSERSSPRAMSATRPRAIRAPLLAPPQKQPFPPTRIGHSRHHTPANRAIAFSPIRPPPADLRPIRADRGLSEGAGRGRQHDRELNMYRESGIKPNFSDIARRYHRDRRTVAAYWKAAASGSPTGPSRPAPRALRGAGVPHHPRHPPGIGGLSPWISPCGPGKRQWPDALLVRAGKPIRMAFPIKNGRQPAPAPKIRNAFLSYKTKRGARRLRRAPRESVVEPRGIEPLTSWLPAMRSPS